MGSLRSRCLALRPARASSSRRVRNSADPADEVADAEWVHKIVWFSNPSAVEGGPAVVGPYALGGK
jgi:hypothetical protein